MKSLLLPLLLLTTLSPTQAHQLSSVPNPKTTNASHFVSNPDGILNNSSVTQINTILQSLETDTKAEVAIVLLNSIEDAEIEDFAVRLFQQWGIGKKGMDNGLLLLFVLDQRAVKFETGYGLEGILPDAICKRIQTQTMIPAFKNGDYDKGIVQAVEQIATLIRNEPVPEPQETKDFTWIEILLPCSLAYIFLLSLSFAWIRNSSNNIRKNSRFRTNPDRYQALNSKRIWVNVMLAICLLSIGLAVIILFLSLGYIFFLLIIPFAVIPVNSFAKAQMRKIRNEPMPCEQCGTMMHILPKKKDNTYLTQGQRVEKKIYSMSYDVFFCDKCCHTAVFGYNIPNSGFTQCPQCKVKALGFTKSQTLVKPTYTSSGTKRNIYTCLSCNYTENKDETLPRLHASAPSYSSGGTSFSGGSFGGGRSGGGGSTSRW